MTEKEEAVIQGKLEYYQSIGYSTHLISNLEDQSELLHLLVPGINVLSGQSGVGKSSLINAVRPESNLETGVISNALNRGKHTTRHVELIRTSEGYIADTPGFSSLIMRISTNICSRTVFRSLSLRQKSVNIVNACMSMNLNVQSSRAWARRFFSPVTTIICR